MVKKRRASGSASSTSTPGPGFPSEEPSARASPDDSAPRRSELDHDARDDGGGERGRAGASASAGTTPAPRGEERTVAKPGTVVVGSGDGTNWGDECFLYTDLPMNRQGELTQFEAS